MSSKSTPEGRLDFAAAWLDEMFGAKEKAHELRKEVAMTLGLQPDAAKDDVVKRLRELIDYADAPVAAIASTKDVAAAVFLAAIENEQRADARLSYGAAFGAVARKYPELVTAARGTDSSALVRFSANRQLEIYARSLEKAEGVSFEAALDRAARERPDLLEMRRSGVVPAQLAGISNGGAR